MPRYAYRIEQGFILIELVMVIVMVGILSAAALPRFSNLSTSAIQAANAQFVGTFKSELNVVHAAWIATGAPNASANGINLEGGMTVFVNNYGWPSGNYDVSNLSVWSAGCASSIQNYFMTNPVGIADVSSGTTCTTVQGMCYYVASAASGGVCTFQYFNNGTNTARGFTYNYTNGQVNAF